MPKQMSQVRIIGGKWRGRKISFLSLPELRPTPDRVRETLFNWLAPVIHDTHCLDVFAGSGVLGFEALSRGAASVVMIDQSLDVIEMLKKNAVQLNIANDNIRLQHAIFPNETLSFIGKKFDIVFLDPPFRKDLVSQSAAWLEQHNYLAEDALIYIEAESELTDLSLPANWQIIRNKTAGQVGYYLVRRLRNKELL